MNKVTVSILMLATAAGAHAKTSIYGEANARLQFENIDGGSSLSIDGSLSEFGYKGEQTLSEQETAFFDIGLGVNALGDSLGVSNGIISYPGLKVGLIGLRGNFGEISAFYDHSPVSKINHYFKLMKNDPDSIRYLLGDNGGWSPTGIDKVDGLSYQSPLIENNITINAALVPAEDPDGTTGISFAGRYDQGDIDVSVGFEVNVEQDSSQLFKVAGEYQTGKLKLGGQVQMSSSSDTDYSSRNFVGFVKLPLKFSQLETNNRIMAGFTTLTNPADDTVDQFYISGLQEIPWTSKVSTYSFVEVLMYNDLEDTRTVIGSGLKIGF
ncbi:porin [Reinekea forsetii]|nr:porin [Reinekea forsetii]